LVLAPNKNPVALADKNTELAVRLKISEEQNRLLREEAQRLKQIEQAYERLKSEHQQTVERKVLLEEEVPQSAAGRTEEIAETPAAVGRLTLRLPIPDSGEKPVRG
jgi:hypothetical protein